MQSTRFRRSGRNPSGVSAMLVTALALTGCTASLPYDPPGMALAARFSRPAPLASRAEAAWWRAFGDPVLDGLMARALEGSPQLAELRARPLAG